MCDYLYQYCICFWCHTQARIDAILPGFYVATTERPDLADMRRITGEVSAVPIMIYTIDNNIPVNIIGEDTVVFKLSTNVPSLDLSCASGTSSVIPSSSKQRTHDLHCIHCCYTVNF